MRKIKCEYMLLEDGKVIRKHKCDVKTFHREANYALTPGMSEVIRPFVTEIDGNDFYEGDIVVYKFDEHNLEDNKYKYIIEWSEEDNRYMALYCKKDDRDIHTGYILNPRLSIIGNIIENPELIK